MTTEVSRWLSKKESEASANPALASDWSSMDRLFSSRLYHQLTVKLLEFCRQPALQSGRQLVELYQHFLKEFETRICALSLMEIVALTVKQMETEEAITFLNIMEPKLGSNKPARALCLLIRADVQLFRLNDVTSTKATLESAEKILDTLGVSSVHSRFYLLQSELYSRQNETAEYYRSALKFLGCTDITTLSHDEQRIHAEKLAVAALISDGIYNFGELLAHPILYSLKRTSKEFLVDLLRVFNTGDIQQFRQLQRQWEHLADLKQNVKALNVKIILLCLMEMTFKRPSFDRQLTFKEITEATGISNDEVEIYVMKAVAKGLIKGRIDQVGQKVFMTWVQPRVLDRVQIAGMIDRLDAWQTTIQSVEHLVANEAADILI